MSQKYSSRNFRLLSLPVFLTVFLLLILVRNLSQASQDINQPALSSEQAGQNLPQPPENRSRLHPDLIKILATAANSDQIPVIIEWNSQPYHQLLKPFFDPKSQTRLQVRSQVVATLQSFAAEQSRSLRLALQEATQLGLASDIQSFWVSPILSARVTPGLLEELSQRQDILQIRPDQRFYLENVEFQPQVTATGYAWNLTLIQVDLTQQQLNLDGSGVVVANLDTGVDWQHPALLKKYRGYNPHGPAQHVGNWFVVTNEPYLVPGDSNGHGTHTLGTMVGEDESGNRTGVAPGARWIAVKLFNNQGYTYESWIHAAFQWIMAPEGNPALSPDIVNCSWGTNSGADDRFRSDIASLRSAGILPVFSAGNNGPSAYTIGSPASYPESLSVGAVDQDKIPALFSARGPSPWAEIKPEVSAPGVDILSTFPGNGYAASNGTSMAAPHVAGLAALLLQAAPSLTPDEIEEILKTTAMPLGSIHPNNDTGWGLINAYSAALRVTAHGELVGFVRDASNNNPVSFPLLTARSLADPEISLTTTGSPTGAFTFALRPDRYDLFVSAFGYLTSTIHNVGIYTNTQTPLNVSLSALPGGVLSGIVTDLTTHLPLSATLTVEGSPLRTHTNPFSGLYTLNLPAGTWKVTIASPVHRTAHLTPTITAGLNTPGDIALRPSPSILLVDGGRWYNGSQISYFKDALDALDYPYRVWSIRTLGLGGLPDERPSPGAFDPYDIVIWSDPNASPGWIGSNEVISAYLKTGGHLFLSGEDILYLDGGGSLFTPRSSYLIEKIGIRFRNEGNLSPLTGASGTFFEGIQLSLNTPDSSRQQVLPDEAIIYSPLKTQASLAWSDHTIGGVTAGLCQPYRAFWTGFGLEGSGPRSQRIELLERILQWFQTPPDPSGIKIFSSSETLIGSPGSSVSQTIQIYNTGSLPDTFNMQIEGNGWPLDLELPGGSHTSSDASLALGSCQAATLTATLTIPPDQPRHAWSSYRINFTSQNDLAVQDALTLTAKTHAPLLLVEHQLWYKNIQPYTQTLSSLGIPYDIAHTQASLKTPSYAMLKNYPLVVWTTGYNWYNPLGPDGEQQLTQYLNGGGRLLLSSQDVLDINGLSVFIKERLGVLGFTLSVTPTEVTGALRQPFHSDLGPWELTFPYKNWGDGLQGVENTAFILEDQNPFPVGLAHQGSNWRSSFFSFPLETLEQPAHHTLLSQALLWLSPFGESWLDTPPAAINGGEVPITLTLQIANDQPLAGLRAEIPLPPQVSLVPGRLEGAWGYDPVKNSLLWEGSLSPAEKIILKAVLQLVDTLPAGTTIPLQARFSDSRGILAVSEAPIQVDVPWLRLSGDASASQAQSGDTIAYTLTVKNAGVISDTAVLSITLPAGISLLAESLHASAGNLAISPAGLQWAGVIPPAAQVWVYFKAAVLPDRPGVKLAVSAQASNGSSRRKIWLVVSVPALVYFPYIAK